MTGRVTKGGQVVNGPVPEAPITLREVYALLDGTRKELLAEISKIATEFRTYGQMHDQEHKEHDRRHEREIEQARKSRSGLIRWAVTSVLTGVGVLIALYVAFTGG